MTFQLRSTLRRTPVAACAIVCLLGMLCVALAARAQNDAARQDEDQALRRIGLDGEGAAARGDMAEAERILSDGLRRAQADGNGAWTARFLTDLSNVYLARGRVQEALESGRRAAAIFEGLGDRPEQAGALNNLANAYASLAKYEDALPLYQQVLAIRQQLGNAADIALTTGNIGLTYTLMGKLDEALDYDHRALDAYQKLGAEAETADILNNLGLLYVARGQFEKARDAHTRALATRRKIGNPHKIATSLNNLGEVCLHTGEYARAYDYFHDALDAYGRAGNPHDIGTALDNMASVWQALGAGDAALKDATLALQQFQQTGNPEDVALSDNNLGAICTDLGRYDDALRYLDDALAAFKKLPNQRHVAGCLQNFGNVYYRLGQHEKALSYYERALAMKETAGNPEDIALTLGALTDVYVRLGQLDKADAAFKRRAKLYDQLDNTQKLAECYYQLANSLYDTGRIARARELADTALKAFGALGDLRDRASALMLVGACEWALGSEDAAEQHEKQALDILEKLGDEAATRLALDNLGQVQRKRKDWQEAHDYFARAIRLYEKEGSSVADPAGVGGFERTQQPDLYAADADALLHLGQPAEALAELERGRGMGLARQAAQSHASLTHLIAASDARELAKRTEDETAAYRELEAAGRRPTAEGPSEQKAREAQLDKARDSYQAAERQLAVFRADLLKRYPDFARLTGFAPATAEQLLALARAHADTVYLAWGFPDNATTLCFVLDAAHGVRAVTLPVNRLKALAAAYVWLSAISRPGGRGVASAATRMAPPTGEKQIAALVYKMLFAPLESQGLLPATARRLVLAPDGDLSSLPFAALLDGQGRRLVERYALSTTVSLGALLWPASSKQPSRSMLCVADPMGAGGESVEIASRGGRFAPLPAAREEARAVAALFPGALRLTGAQATKREVVRQMGEYRILHFATHGILDSASVFRSGLLLRPAPGKAAADGVLSAGEILATPLAARLAVLSACETGQGEEAGGEGVQGLSWAFLAAGCPSVVASLWDVDDAATRALMVRFYEELKQGKKKDEALRAAMLSVKGEPAHPPPYYWAAFEVIGDTSPLSAPGP